MTEAALAAVPALALAGAVATQLPRRPRVVDRANRAAACATAALAAAVAVAGLADPAAPVRGGWLLLDGAGAVLLLTVAVVGLVAALASPLQLAGTGRGLFRAGAARRRYYLALHLFWAALLAVPLVGNLAVAWLLVEATTAASAVLVAFSGSARALEAGWKYLVLTTFGLAFALLGIVVLADAAGGGLAALDYAAIHAAAAGLPPEQALTAFVLIAAGLAAKAGWAPVHNWLPDAHSEAPPAVSALLSAALLPVVALVAWRAATALEPGLPPGLGGGILIAFGLASLAVAVPFLWRPLAYKRLLAYSSLEHMGVIALGIGFGTPLAIAGVIAHVAGHALAKSLGFCAAVPLLRHDPAAARRPARGLARTSPATAGAVGVSLGALSGLPPSPLFVSELLVLAGGLAAGEPAVTVVAAGLLALGFLGVAHAAVEAVAGESRGRAGSARRSAGWTLRLTGATVAGMVAVAVAAMLLPGSELVHDAMAGIG